MCSCRYDCIICDLFLVNKIVQVILATNIAESSVTIPHVGYVIDSCRSLQVFWDNNRKTESAELVWVSRSQVSCGSLQFCFNFLLLSVYVF